MTTSCKEGQTHGIWGGMHSCILCLWLFATVRQQMLAEKRQNTPGTPECGKLFRWRNLCCVQSCAYDRLCAPPHNNMEMFNWLTILFPGIKTLKRWVLSDLKELLSRPLRGVAFPNSKVQKPHKNILIQQKDISLQRRPDVIWHISNFSQCYLCKTVLSH